MPSVNHHCASQHATMRASDTARPKDLHTTLSPTTCGHAGAGAQGRASTSTRAACRRAVAAPSATPPPLASLQAEPSCNRSGLHSRLRAASSVVCLKTLAVALHDSTPSANGGSRAPSSIGRYNTTATMSTACREHHRAFQPTALQQNTASARRKLLMSLFTVFSLVAQSWCTPKERQRGNILARERRGQTSSEHRRLEG